MADRGRGLNIALWGVTGLLTALYLFTGAGKLVAIGESIQQFDAFGYPVAFRIFIGVCELAGALGLLVPRLATLAAGGLMGIMVGAAYTHLSVDEAPFPPLLAFAMLAFVGWLRRADLPARVGPARV
jgi:uncharacterized membrane protein YphA (DoxX/SURF4 family)